LKIIDQGRNTILNPGESAFIKLPPALISLVERESAAGKIIWNKRCDPVKVDDNFYKVKITVMADENELFGVVLNYQVSRTPMYWRIWLSIKRFFAFDGE
jgi:hypothetical protein